MKKKEELNKDEKIEIKADVKDALGKAKKASIDKINETGPDDVLNQNEIDKLMDKKNKSKEKDSIKPVIITIVLIVLIALSGLYIYFSNNPKTIFVKAIDKTFNKIEKSITPKYDTAKGSAEFDMTFDKDKINANIYYESDIKKGLLNADIKTTYNDEQLIDLNLYNETDTAYIYSEDLLNKYIEFESNYTDVDGKIITNALNEAFKAAISGEKLNGAKKQIKIDGKMVKTYKSSLTINETNIDRMTDSAFKSLINNDKFMNQMSKTFNLSQTEVNGKITDVINHLRKQVQENQVININIYTKGARQSFVMFEIIGADRKINITKTDDKITYTVTDKNNNKQIEGEILIGNSTEINGTYKKGSTTHLFNITIKSNAEKIKEVTKKEIKDSTKYNELSDSEKLEMTFKLFANPAITKLLIFN